MSKKSIELLMTYSTITRMQDKIDFLDVESRTLRLLLQQVVDEFDRDDLHPELIEISRRYLMTIGKQTP